MSSQCSRFQCKKEVMPDSCPNAREREGTSLAPIDGASDALQRNTRLANSEAAASSWSGWLKQWFRSGEPEAYGPSEEVRTLADNGLVSSYPCSGPSQGTAPTETSNSMEVLSNEPESTKHNWLSTHREKSTIPMYGTQQTWVYPSSLQFYKAMERRDKNPDASAMDAVVYVHNHVNEETWKAILKWEEMHSRKCTASRALIRFTGRYADLSWKAWWKTRFCKMDRPFDRHDWTIDRCGKPVRYIIDYYDDASKNDDFQVTIDARPAPDSVQNIYDRVRYWGWQYFKQSSAASPRNT